MEFLNKKALLTSLRNLQFVEFASVGHEKEYDLSELLRLIEVGASCFSHSGYFHIHNQKSN